MIELGVSGRLAIVCAPQELMFSSVVTEASVPTAVGTCSTNYVRRGSVATTAEVAVSQQWIRKRSPGNVDDAAGVGAVGGLTFFTDVVKSHVDESGTLTRI
ncbi:unnamed protein product [Prorocentrum cordatum]|uniref:Uncharacterized protein n=1 Tax=Prorocentrum cordatum TaxID=2364126 RepID=A0ABN9W580_9DINO|nr:unnamed protein product [Polarella glacialis]